MTTPDTSAKLLPDFNSTAMVRHRKWRNIKDVLARYLMAIGGVGVIIAIVLIAFYLIYVVMPMFKPAHLELVQEYAPPGGASADSIYYAVEEQREVGLRVMGDGQMAFFTVHKGNLLKQENPLANVDANITAFAAGDPSQSLLAFGLENGAAILIQHDYQVSYPNDQRLITPQLYYPFGDEPIQITEQGVALTHITAQYNDEEASIAAISEGGGLWLLNITKEESFLSDEVELIQTVSQFPIDRAITHIAMDVDQRELYAVASDGTISFYDIQDKSASSIIDRVEAVPDGVEITSLDFLSGGISILVGDSRGRITQWFPVRDENNKYRLEQIRHFDSQSAPITKLVPEYFRKGFVAVDEAGELGIYHTTAHRTVKHLEIGSGPLKHLAIAPRANALLLEDEDKNLQLWHVDNEHPEISWTSIWGKVWYESRDKPEYIWQSSSASSDFEPKFSLTPLAFGTFKASFYAMLFAIPMSVLGAMYTAYFMSARMRGSIKPTIELMAALPTVILGFLAGLWFAPFVEKHMPGTFAMILVLPFSVLLASYCWQLLPERLRHKVPSGWEAALLIPVIILAILVSIIISQPMEAILFDGNMPLWISTELGLDFDQRNSLVVGIAMGFAVIPTIFSISEDAIYEVPKHLTTGSLALGATHWQTMVRVVLLTASPGIFSAIMIGLGRAVGETMIVVMATGNTAIMDMNIFQGFRALSANIAVEMPESEVGSTHYRILFLAGLVLFAATFFLNTLAEVVRQRLRNKYSSL